MKKEELKNLDIDSIDVKLPEILGVKPRIYLAVIYSIIILLLLFFIFLFPGLRKNGTHFYLSSSAPGSAVFVDGRHEGSTPGKFFIKKGSRNINVRHPYYNDFNMILDVKGRLFFSLFSPEKDELSFDLKLDDPQGLYSSAIKETAEWGLIKYSGENYQPRPVISTTVASLLNTGHDDLAENFLNEALSHVTNKYMLSDWLKADSMVIAGNYSLGAVYSAISLFDFMQKMDKYPNLLFLLYSMSFNNTEQKIEIKESDIYKTTTAEIKSLIEHTSDYLIVNRNPLDFDGMTFKYFEGGKYVSGRSDDNMGLDLTGTASHPVLLDTQGFYMLDREVTRGAFAEFLDANPDWKRENIVKLISQGYVNESYLADWDDKDSSLPVYYISWYAADAFCAYLTEKLPASLKNQGYKAALPGETQWEFAALLNSENEPVFKKSEITGPQAVNGRSSGKAGIYDMYGNLWEWCSDWYTPSGRFYSDIEGNRAYSVTQAAEKSVRGGSWANDKAGITAAERGFQPPDWCTPYTGFRVVISKD